MHPRLKTGIATTVICASLALPQKASGGGGGSGFGHNGPPEPLVLPVPYSVEGLFERVEERSLRAKVRKLKTQVAVLKSKLRTRREKARAVARCKRPETIIQLGCCLQQRGARVSEHPAFGGVAPVHHGKCHYAARALDVNTASGESAGEIFALDGIATYLRSIPRTWILWRVPGHWNHLHVSFDCVG